MAATLNGGLIWRPRACAAIVAICAQRHDQIVLVLTADARDRCVGPAGRTAMAAVAQKRGAATLQCRTTKYRYGASGQLLPFGCTARFA